MLIVGGPFFFGGGPPPFFGGGPPFFGGGPPLFFGGGAPFFGGGPPPFLLHITHSHSQTVRQSAGGNQSVTDGNRARTMVVLLILLAVLLQMLTRSRSICMHTHNRISKGAYPPKRTEQNRGTHKARTIEN